MQRRVLQKLRTAPFDPGMWRVAQPRMEFLNEPRLADPRLADDQYQLAVALPRPLPSPRQHRDFLIATHQRREMTSPPAPSAAARPHEPEKRYRLRHAFEFMAAPLLGDKQAGDLTLDPRCHDDGARLR